MQARQLLAAAQLVVAAAAVDHILTRGRQHAVNFYHGLWQPGPSAEEVPWMCQAEQQ
jgi:hypothetical protein